MVRSPGASLTGRSIEPFRGKIAGIEGANPMLTALGFVAMAGVLIGFVWILFSAFGDNIGLGIAILFISPLAFIYGFMRWDELKVPTVLLCAGVAAQIAKRTMLH